MQVRSFDFYVPKLSIRYPHNILLLIVVIPGNQLNTDPCYTRVRRPKLVIRRANKETQDLFLSLSKAPKKLGVKLQGFCPGKGSTLPSKNYGISYMEKERYLVEGHLLVRDLDALLESDGEVVRARVHRLNEKTRTKKIEQRRCLLTTGYKQSNGGGTY